MESQIHTYNPFLIPILSLLLLNSINVCFCQDASPGPAPTSESEPLVSEIAFSPNANAPEASESGSDSESLKIIPLPVDSESDNTLTGSLIKSDNPIIGKLCTATDYPDLCLSTIGSLGKGKVDVYQVVEKTITAGNDLATTGLAYAEKLVSDPSTKPDVVETLKECAGSYDNAMYNFEEAKIALPQKDTGRMNSMLSAVITDVTDCEDLFSGQVSPMASHAEKVIHMTSNCLAIISVIPDYETN